MNGLIFILFLLFLLALLGVGPILTILSLNLLFGLAIPINFATWAATAWLGLLITGVNYSKN